MEERVWKLEKEFANLQKILYKMEASLEIIADQISWAINLKEQVVRLDEKQKSWINKLNIGTNKREILERQVAKIENKLSLYAGWITIIAIVVPYIIKIILE